MEYKVKVDGQGNIHWYHNDLLHREDGPAVEWADGAKFWYRNGLYHREDGPAVVYANGDKVWYINDRLHREDGPAIEYARGAKRWYLDGKNLTEELFNARMNPAKELTVEQISQLLGYEVKVVKE